MTKSMAGTVYEYRSQLHQDIQSLRTKLLSLEASRELLAARRNQAVQKETTVLDRLSDADFDREVSKIEAETLAVSDTRLDLIRELRASYVWPSKSGTSHDWKKSGFVRQSKASSKDSCATSNDPLYAIVENEVVPESCSYSRAPSIQRKDSLTRTDSVTRTNMFEQPRCAPAAPKSSSIDSDHDRRQSTSSRQPSFSTRSNSFQYRQDLLVPPRKYNLSDDLSKYRELRLLHCQQRASSTSSQRLSLNKALPVPKEDTNLDLDRGSRGRPDSETMTSGESSRLTSTDSTTGTDPALMPSEGKWRQLGRKLQNLSSNLINR